ncbi:PHO85 cyclin-1 [Mucor circinelloides]
MDETILKDIQDLIRRPVSSELLAFVAEQAALVIPCYSNTTIITTAVGVLPPLHSFIGFLVKRSSVRTGTLLGSLVFLHRLQQSLSNIAKGMPCTSHRIFLATLIVTSKALHDTSPKNKHWAKYAAYFTLSEINLMEKQLLSLMNYHVLISPADLSNAYYRFKQYTNPSVAAEITKPIAVLTTTAQHHANEADIPTYAAATMYSSQLALSNSSLSSSLSSESDSSVSTMDDEAELYYYKIPPEAHIRNRKNHQI